MSTQKQFVRIQSSINITVTAGLDAANYTKENSDVPNRMKIEPQWQKATVQIKQGSHLYPSEIASWNTVKALQRDGILTIGDFTDDADEATVSKKKDLKQGLEEIKKNNFRLEDVAKGE